MQRTRVVLLGPESSGNRWLYSILHLHPELEVFRTSYPRWEHPSRCYPNLEVLFETTFNENDCLIIVSRDQTITQLSVDNTGRNNPYPDDMFTQKETLQKVHRVYTSWPGKKLFFSYETAMAWKNDYFRHIFEQLGVSTNFVYPVDYKDGNQKYIRNPQ